MLQKESAMDSLIVIRDQIDRMDRQIVELLDRRTALAARLSHLKLQEGQCIEDPNREKQVLEKVKRYSTDPVVKQHIGELYEQVMRIAKIKQQSVSCNTVPFEHIGIIGQGMMGGSIAKGLKRADPTVQITFINGEEELLDAMPSIDLLILAIPTSEVLKVTPLIVKVCHGVTVMDIASVKQDVVDLFEKHSQGSVEFVGTHPMAGSEKSGITHSRGDLFMGRRWVITPHQNNCPKTLILIEELIQCLHAEVVYMDARSHDEKIGLVSHMVRVLSSSLYAFTLENDPMSLEVAGPGFHSMTRLAQGNEELQNEMMTYNREYILKHLDAFVDHLTVLKKEYSMLEDVRQERVS
jgi:prephenate dehydrogenase/chorismate mutase